jgi:hypothetical protein
MHARPARASTLSLVVSTALIATMSGCGGSTYDSLVNRRLDQLRGSAPFRTLFAPTSIPETPLKIRVPMAFRASYTAESRHGDDGGQISPQRLQPPFVELPGLKLCYESRIDDPAGGGKLPFYCYIAAVPQGNADKIAADLQAKLKETFNNAPAEWTNVDAKTPEDKGLPWRKIRIAAEQPFLVRGEKTESKNLPGIFELWIHDAKDYVVIIGWRTPASIDGPAPAPNPEDNPLMQLTQDPKPDFNSMPALTAGTLKIDPEAKADAAG